MFSGRHFLERNDNKIFIDRDPRAFRMMIDFIRNNGQLYEEQENNIKMLQLELKYWGIDENMFQHKDQIDIIQEILDRPIQDIFDKEDESQFFYDQLNSNPKLDLRQLLKEKKLKFNDNFRIGNI